MDIKEAIEILSEAPKNRVWVAVELDTGLDGQDPSIHVLGVFTDKATANRASRSRGAFGDVAEVPLNKPGRYFPI